MSRNWFGSVFIVDLNSPFSRCIFFFTYGKGNTVDDIGGNTRQMIGDSDSSRRSRN